MNQTFFGRLSPQKSLVVAKFDDFESVTIRRALQGVDRRELEEVFEEWVA